MTASAPVVIADERVLVGEAASVAAARAFVRQALGQVPGVAAAAVQDAAMCTSELVTNAIVHTRSGNPGGTFRLGVQLHRTYAVVEVEDQGRTDGAGPELRLGDGLGEGGRGLWIVSQLAASLQDAPTEHGHLVRARIALFHPLSGEVR
jgi:anti-sigma regulatory factor (Ser/Thr protein kinase)